MKSMARCHNCHTFLFDIILYRTQTICNVIIKAFVICFTKERKNEGGTMKERFGVINRYRSIILVTLFLVIFTTIPNVAKSERFAIEPTVFVHGYKGTYRSFGQMLDRFEKDYKWGKKVLVYYIFSNGQMHVTHVNHDFTGPAFIQVVFENNRASFEDNTNWLANVMKHLHQTYQVNSMKLVGHSMGGIISLKYLEDYSGLPNYPLVSKLVTIGSPFDGIHREGYFMIHNDPAATDLKPNSHALQALRTNKALFPRETAVLSIGSTGDQTASPESVRAIQSIIPNEQLDIVMIKNKYLSHPGLHEDREVDQMIHDFLYSE